MLLLTLRNRSKPSDDTRAYLDVDDDEAKILIELLERDLADARSQS